LKAQAHPMNIGWLCGVMRQEKTMRYFLSGDDIFGRAAHN
jgi:hypothetical protein